MHIPLNPKSIETIIIFNSSAKQVFDICDIPDVISKIDVKRYK